MFTDRNKGGDQPKDLYERLRSLIPEACPENALCAFQFNLDPSRPEGRCDGILYADQTTLRLVTDGQITLELPLSEIAEIKTDSGVGCIFVSYVHKADGSAHLLCRSDMSTSRQIIQSLKRLNYFLEDGKIHIGDNDLLKAHLLNSAVKMSAERGRGKLVKVNPALHIDGCAALLDAMTVRQKWYSEIGEQLRNEG